MSDAGSDSGDATALLSGPADEVTESAAQTDVVPAPEHAVDEPAAEEAAAEEAATVPPLLHHPSAADDDSVCTAADENLVVREALLAGAGGDEGSAVAAEHGRSAVAEALASSDVLTDGAASEQTQPAASAVDPEANAGGSLIDDDGADDPAAAASPLTPREASAATETHLLTKAVVEDGCADPAAQTALLAEATGTVVADESAVTDSDVRAEAAGSAEEASHKALTALVDAAAATVVATSNGEDQPADALSSTPGREAAGPQDAGVLPTLPIEETHTEEVQTYARGNENGGGGMMAAELNMLSAGQLDAADPLPEASGPAQIAAEAAAVQTGPAIASSQHSGEVDSHPLSFAEGDKATADLDMNAGASAGDGDGVGAGTPNPKNRQQDDGTVASEPLTPGTPDAMPPTPTAAAAAYLTPLSEQPLMPAQQPPTPAEVSATPELPAAAPSASQPRPAPHAPSVVQTARAVHPDVYFATTRAALPGGRVSCMAVRAAGASGSYTFGSEEGRKIRLGVVPSVVPWQERSAEASAGQPMALDTPAGEELSPADFFEEIAEAAAEAPLSAVGKVGFEAGTRGGVLLFVHGVAIKFEQAVRRASQMKVDLDFPGPIIAYAWPSLGDQARYAEDRRRCRSGQPAVLQLRRLLDSLLSAADVIVVAHGMGARLVIEAVGGEAEAPMAAIAPPRCLRFVFVAPDVRADTFKQRLARFPAGTARTMYCNSNDQVMRMTPYDTPAKRAGDAVQPCIDPANFVTIDATVERGKWTSVYGSYFGAAEEVLADVRLAVAGVSVDERIRRGTLFPVRRAGNGMYRVSRQAQQPLQRSASSSSAGLPPSYPVSVAASRSDTEDGSTIVPALGIPRGTRTPPELQPLPVLAAVALKANGPRRDVRGGGAANDPTHGGALARQHSRSTSMSGSDAMLGPPSPPGYETELPAYRSVSWTSRTSTIVHTPHTSFTPAHSASHSCVSSDVNGGPVDPAGHWHGAPSEGGVSMLRDSEAESSPRSSIESGRLVGAYGRPGCPPSMGGFMWPQHVKAPTAAPPDRRKLTPEIQPADDGDDGCAPAAPSDWTCDRILQALQLLFAEQAGDWYESSASPALHEAAATAHNALLSARDHAALSGAPGPPPARFVARLLSAIDYRPVVLELLDNRFPADVRETAAAALRVAEMGSAAAFAAIVPTGAPAMASLAPEMVLHTGPERPAHSGGSLRSTESSSSAANSSTAAVAAESNGCPDTGLEVSSGVAEALSDVAPGSLPSVSSEAQMSGHAEADDEATSLPHVDSNESVTEAEPAAAPDSPLTAARVAARGISDDGIRYGQPGPPVVAAPGSPEAARGAYSGLLAAAAAAAANDAAALRLVERLAPANVEWQEGQLTGSYRRASVPIGVQADKAAGPVLPMSAEAAQQTFRNVANVLRGTTERDLLRAGAAMLIRLWPATGTPENRANIASIVGSADACEGLAAALAGVDGVAVAEELLPYVVRAVVLQPYASAKLLPCFGGVLYLLDTAGGRLSAAGRRHAAAAVARLGAMAPGNKAAEAAVRAACGCPGTGGRRASVDVDARKQKLDKEVDQPALSDTEKLRGRHETAQPQTADDAPSSTALNLLVNMLWEMDDEDDAALLRDRGSDHGGSAALAACGALLSLAFLKEAKLAIVKQHPQAVSRLATLSQDSRDELRVAALTVLASLSEEAACCEALAGPLLDSAADESGGGGLCVDALLAALSRSGPQPALRATHEEKLQAARALLRACEAAAARAWSSAIPAAFAGNDGRTRLAAMLAVAVTEPVDGDAAGGPGEARRLVARALCTLALAGDAVLGGLEDVLSGGDSVKGSEDGSAEASLEALARLVDAASGPAQNRGLAVLRAALR